jgi:hypothetical protein
MYDLIADDQELRNGYSVFRRRAAARSDTQYMGPRIEHLEEVILSMERSPFCKLRSFVIRQMRHVGVRH